MGLMQALGIPESLNLVISWLLAGSYKVLLMVVLLGLFLTVSPPLPASPGP